MDECITQIITTCPSEIRDIEGQRLKTELAMKREKGGMNDTWEETTAGFHTLPGLW